VKPNGKVVTMSMTDHRALAERLSQAAYLPGVTYLDPVAQPSATSPAAGRDREASRASQCEMPVDFAVNVTSDDETAVENGLASEREERRSLEFLTSPIPRGSKMFSSISRHHTTLRVSWFGGGGKKVFSWI